MNICLSIRHSGNHKDLEKTNEKIQEWNLKFLKASATSSDRSWESDRSWPAYAQPLEILPCSLAGGVGNSQGLELGRGPLGRGRSVLYTGVCQHWASWASLTSHPITHLDQRHKLIILALHDWDNNTSIHLWEDESDQPDFSRLKLLLKKCFRSTYL